MRIGDLVENAGAAADVPVFRAPDLGQTGAVPVARIADALRPHDLIGLDTGGLSEVVVTRLVARDHRARTSTDRIARALAGQYGFGDAQNLAVILDRDVRVAARRADGDGDLAVVAHERRAAHRPLRHRLRTARQHAVARALPLRFTGTVTETVEAATLTRSLRAARSSRRPTS